MILRQIALQDFGTYGGTQCLDLSINANKNVILIGGKNGSGKSTLLEAIRLCFYGQFAMQPVPTRDRYERYLLDRIHRDPSTSIPPRSASIGIDFDYGDQDGIRTYKAVRQWERNSDGGVKEQFDLSCNGSPVADVEPAHWQDFVQELIPIGVSDLFFFDGEKVQHLAEDESDKKTLSGAVSHLLGTDILEKLSADLNIYRSRAVQRAAAEDKSAANLEILNLAVEELRTRRDIVGKDSDSANIHIEALTLQVQTLERQLQEQGGAYAKNRGKLEERKRQISVRVMALEDTIREHAHGLLPVALAPKLLNSLMAQLELEQDVRFGVVVDEALTNAAKKSLSKLRNIKVKVGNKLLLLGTLTEFKAISSAIKNSHQSTDWDEAAIVHDLSNEQEQQVRAWTQTAIDTLPRSLRATAEELETLYREQQKVERDLSRAPQDDVLQPLIDKLSNARKYLADAVHNSAQMRVVVDEVGDGLSRAEANYMKAVEALATNNVQRQSLEKAAKVQDVLAEFKYSLTVKKVGEIEKEVTNCFNLLSRKRIQRSICINPTTFQVLIRDNHSRTIPKSELSAGEKQIYAISVLWALARVSGRPLPMIIDTPLARLDRDHRSLLGYRYFPNASHQVIILSTDSEIDAEFIPLLGESVARSYELSFDVATQSTRVLDGYFSEVMQYEVH